MQCNLNDDSKLIGIIYDWWHLLILLSTSFNFGGMHNYYYCGQEAVHGWPVINYNIVIANPKIWNLNFNESKYMLLIVKLMKITERGYILLVRARSWLLHASRSIVATFIIKLTIICMHVWTRTTKTDYFTSCACVQGNWYRDGLDHYSWAITIIMKARTMLKRIAGYWKTHWVILSRSIQSIPKRKWFISCNEY